MAVPPKPLDTPTDADIDARIADRLERAVERVLSRTKNDPASSGRQPPASPPDAAKTIHNETTKLKANTLNAVAIAFLVGGVIAPLISATSLGSTPRQTALGALWLFLGFLLHFMAQRVLKGLQP